jgi:hypothetical protein
MLAAMLFYACHSLHDTVSNDRLNNDELESKLKEAVVA